MFIAAGIIIPSHNLFGYKGKEERKRKQQEKKKEERKKERKKGTFLHWFKQLKYASHVATFSSEERGYSSALIRIHGYRSDLIPIVLVLPKAHFGKRLVASTDTSLA